MHNLHPTKTQGPAIWWNFSLANSLGHVEIALLPLRQKHIPAAVAALFLNPFVGDRNSWGKRLTSTGLVVIPWLLRFLLLKKSFTCDWFIFSLCPFREVYLHISFPNLLITNPPIMIFPNPWISSQTISLCPWIHIDPWLWPSLLSDKHMENQLYHPNFCPLEGFCLPCCPSGPPLCGIR